MSVRVMSWVWHSSQAEGIDRLVLLAIADSANDDGGNAWPSIATLVDKAKVGERTVQRAVRRLVAIGELEVAPNAGRHGVNVYRVTMAPRQTDTPYESHPVTMTPRPVGAPSQSALTPVTQSPTPRPSDTRTVLNHPEPSEREPPSMFCSRHPNGTEQPCGPCGTAKMRAAAWAKSTAGRLAAAREAAKAAAMDCPDCGGSDWLEDESGRPVRKCSHDRRKAAVS